MKKAHLLALAPLAFFVAGCSGSGSDVPIEEMPRSTATNTDPSKSPIQGNPNIPQAAKDAMSGKK